MAATEKRPVGRPLAHDPYEESRECMRTLAIVQQDIRACINTVGILTEQSQFIHAGLERMQQLAGMDEPSRKMASEADKRLYFARHFFPEYMESELKYMKEQLAKLQIYLEVHLPQKQEEEV